MYRILINVSNHDCRLHLLSILGNDYEVAVVEDSATVRQYYYNKTYFNIAITEFATTNLLVITHNPHTYPMVKFICMGYGEKAAMADRQSLVNGWFGIKDNPLSLTRAIQQCLAHDTVS